MLVPVSLSTFSDMSLLYLVHTIEHFLNYNKIVDTSFDFFLHKYSNISYQTLAALAVCLLPISVPQVGQSAYK